MKIKYRFNALNRMFERSISQEEVLKVLEAGKVIEDYPNDQPYPSCLRLGIIKNRPTMGKWVREEETIMKCVVCKYGDTKPGSMTATLTRGETTIVFKQVPADVCDNCGEEYLSDKISAQLLRQAEEAVKSGIQVDVRKYRDAA